MSESKCDRLERLNAEYLRQIQNLEEKIDYLNLCKFRRFTDDECWIWNSDRPNSIESLVCPIVIHKDDLMRIAREGFNSEEGGQIE